MKRIFEDINYTVEFDPKGYYVDFIVWEGVDHSDPDPRFTIAPHNDYEPDFIGSIKYDGCSNWHFEGDNYQIHFCGETAAKNFGILLNRLYEIAMEFMPTYDKETTDH